jgi:hypothetical protein
LCGTAPVVWTLCFVNLHNSWDSLIFGDYSFFFLFLLNLLATNRLACKYSTPIDSPAFKIFWHSESCVWKTKTKKEQHH